MAHKYLYNNAGQITERELTVSSAGAGDAGKGVALDTAGRLDSTVMPVGIGADTKSIVSSENLAAGNLVNVWYDVDTVKVRKADATTAGKEAVGFVLSAVTSPAEATVYFENVITGLSGLTPGTTQFLATTAGGRTEMAPSSTGNIIQKVGVAVSATELSFEPGETIVLV